VLHRSAPVTLLINDELIHARIIDGIRLCKAARFRYKTSDISDLEAKRKAVRRAPHCSHHVGRSHIIFDHWSPL